MKNIRIISLIAVVLVLGIVVLSGCNPAAQPQPEPAEVEHTQWTILTDTIYQTTVHHYVTDKPGPRVCLVGGTHGDELAGWNAGLKLVDMIPEWENVCGEILLIPQANILADNLQQRYPGSTDGGMYDGIKYTDLNRAFPGNANGTPTEQIALAISDTVKDFQPDYIVDLHESRHSWSTSDSLNLGDTLIHGGSKSALFMLDLIDYYNDTYREEGDVEFAYNGYPPEGSFNQYFTGYYPEAVVFTIETNRELALEKRVSQQILILTALFDVIWQ